MESKEIKVNEEMIGATEEMVETGTERGLKIAVGVGATVFVGILTYKYIVKPLIAKIKARKECFSIDPDEPINYKIKEDLELEEE